MRTLLSIFTMVSLTCLAEEPAASAISTGQGIMVGEVTPTSANVQVRLTQGTALIDRDLPGMPGTVTFSLSGTDQKASVEAKAENDFIARAVFSDLESGKEYTCTTEIAGKAGPTAVFRTLPGADSDAETRFVVVTGMNYAKFHGDDRINRKRHLIENNTELPKPYDGPDKALGYPALESILQLKPHFFVGTGDNVYYDGPKSARAKTVTEMRRKWHEQFVQPRYHDLFAEVPTYWMIDDHDYRINDGDNTGDHDPSPEAGRRMMLEQLPVAGMDDRDAKTYRTYRVNQDLQIWFVENRMYRSPNADPDGPEKSIWGAEQKAWLMRTLEESDATFKILISPTPMVGPDDLRKFDNHTNIGGFRHERDAFFAWLKEKGLDQNNRFFIVCGDRHWQYHAIDSTGIEEFSCGALVDANSRLGRKPGDPESTDPDGLIQQPYMQDPRSGGFLEVGVKRGEGGLAELGFTWYDEKGVVLHQTSKGAE